MNTENKTVLCSKFNQDLPALEKPPFKGEVGEQIYNNVSAKAWNEWLEMQIKVINEYRLDLSDSKQYQQLIDTMLGFLQLNDTKVPEVGDETRGQQS